MDPATMSYAQLLEAYQALQEHVSALEGAVDVQPWVPASGHAEQPMARPRQTVAGSEACLAGGGEMGALMRTLDWAQTPIGPVETWPQSLRSAVSILLPSKAQIVLFWGSELITIYNDAYAPVLGAKHPWALGRPARECWSEVWHVIGPLFEDVVRTGEAFWAQDHPFFLQRQEFLEETYFDVSYDPVRIEDGSVGGVFCIVSEQTGRVLGERRLRTLRELGTRTAGAKSAEEVCREAAATLALDPADVPFSLLYLLDGSGLRAELGGVGGIELDDLVSGRDMVIADVDALASTREGRVAEVATEVFVIRAPETAAERVLVLPISSGTQIVGALVAGVSRFLHLAGDYRDFFDLAAARISAAMANAHAYEEERRRAEVLAELDRAKTTFFSNVSHEFRTPLTLMLGPVEDILAKPEGQVVPEHREILTIVHRNGLRLQKLVNTLLDFSRIEAGRVEASYEPTDLATVTADLASVFRSAIERARLDLVVECPPLPDAVYVDRDMWEKIVLNLLSNAFKFTFAGEIAVSLCWGGDHVALRVRDTGTGMPAHELPHLFERFYRIPNARARTYEGTGIGLALVQELVRLHGGEITVVSEVSVGTTFTVTIPTGTAHLPADRVGAARSLASTTLGAEAFVEEALRWLPDEPAWVTVSVAAVTPPPPGSRTATPARILLVDDNADMREYVRRLLSQYWEVVAVADGLKALEVACERVPDLVLADVMMPGLDGFALLRALRADPRTREVPILLLSARAGEESRVEGLQAGADDYLIKPFSARELLARVEAHLTVKRLRDETQATVRKHATQLESALEELQTRDEELRQQNDALIATRLAVERERARYAALFALAPEGYLVTDAAGVIREANPAAVSLLGVAPERLVGKPLRHYVAQADRQSFSRLLARLQTQEREQDWEMQLHPRHGRPFPASITVAVSPSTPPQPPSLHWLIRDHTERKQAEEALHTLTATLEQHVQERTALLDLIQDVTRTANETPTSAVALQYAVDRVCAYMGWPIGHVYLAVAPGDDRWAPTALWHLDDPGRFTAFQQATQGLECAAGADLIGRVGARGQPEWLRDVATDPTFQRRRAAQEAGLRTGVAWPLLVGSEVAGVLEFYTTEALAPNPTLLEAMTQIGTQLGRTIERERAAAQVLQQQEALLQREKLAAMSTMLASVAHELNNPLASIVLQTELLREDVGQGALAEPVMEITQAAARCERLVRQFLTLARQHQPERTRVALNTLVAETMELLAYPLRVDNVTVHLHLDDQVPPLWGDPHQLQQVLLNLLTNAQHALRAAPGAREVTVTTQYDPTQHRITLAVTDTGPGIPPALQTRIFEPFFTTKPPGVGTGLGLPLCRGMVEAHGGTLEVSSAPGHGATFRLTLPVGAVPASLPAPRSADEGAAVRGQTILVVDDEVSLASGLARLLRRDGHIVDTVANGRLALAHLDGRAYDLILCDVRMPELDGPSFYRLLERQQPHLCSRLIFLTGDTLEPATQAFLEASGAPCLLKPFAIAEARRVIQRTLQGAAPSAPGPRLA